MSDAPLSELRPPHLAPLSAVSAGGDDAAHLLERGQAAERAGQRHEARRCYEAALHRLSENDPGARSAALFRWIARTFMTDGDPDAAMDCADVALAVSEAWADRAGEGHAVNVQAAIRWAQGDLDAAEALFLRARSCGVEMDERALVAMTSHNLGIIANIRGDLAEALHHYNVGLENYRALDRQGDVVHALNNLGRLHTDLQRWPDAARAYAEAIEICTEIGDRSSRIGLEVNVAEMCIVRGDRTGASGALENAVRLSSETGDSAWVPHIEKLQGILHREAGEAPEAEAAFGRAVDLSEARQDLLLLAEALRERAELYQREGRNREAMQNLNRAHRLFTQLRAKRELANIDRSVARLEDDFTAFVRRWGESIEAKDRYTQGHCMRVADLSCAIAALCGIDDQSLFWFRIGALLHDVGKLVVPSEILNKPGKLTDAEWTVMRSHPSVGVDMLAGIDFPWDVRPIIESHHERWDGRGYPHGLRGDDIPLSARILAVADVYDALTSLRSYKASSTHEAAMEIMRRDIDAAFDPRVFAAFEAVMERRARPDTRAENDQSTSTGGPTTRPALDVATGDRLTGLPLRDSFERIASQALSDRRATRGVVALIALRVESSDGWSDVYRRRVLRWIAQELRAATRTSDFVARTEENQFMALLPNATRQQAQSVMTRVQSVLARRVDTQGRGLNARRIRATLVTAPDDGDTVDTLFERVDGTSTESETASRTRAG
jgi:putative nucleotidyltransferase with HDIG domain/diguanylate cyclase (GGDEF)-like protein